MEVVFNTSELTKDITMNVTITGIVALNIKLFIGTRLIKLAAFIMGVGIKIDNEPESTLSRTSGFCVIEPVKQ